MVTKAYIGTTNKAKVEACKIVLKDYDVIPLKSDSQVSNQPKSDEETMLGAYNRAKNLPKDGIRIGLEAGVTFHNDKLFLINWGVLIDEDDNVYYAGGTRIELPDFVKEGIFNEDKELAEIMSETYHDKDIHLNQGAIGIFTENQVERVDIFIHIVKLLYGQYLHAIRREK